MRLRALAFFVLVGLGGGMQVGGFQPQAARAQSLLQTVPEAVGLSSPRLERLGAELDRYVAEGRLAGGVVQVSRRGKVAYLHAFGQRDREAGVAMTSDAIFRIASQTKAVVSVAALLLQEEGRLLISDPVGKYIPEFQKTTVAVPRAEGGYDVVPAKRPITVRDLLTHTSGVGYGGGIAKDKWEEARITGWYFADRQEPIAATVARMASLPFDAQPGEAYVYGYNTDILGVVLEKASGTPLDQLLQQKLFEPLGMRDTHFYLPTEKRDRLAVVYGSSEGGLKRIADAGGIAGQGEYLEGPRQSFSGGAGLLSTAHDYGRFLQMLLDKGVSGGRRVISRKTVELMTVDHLGSVRFPWSNGTGFGLGVSVVEDLGGGERRGRWESLVGEAPTTRPTGLTPGRNWWWSISRSCCPPVRSMIMGSCGRWSTRPCRIDRRSPGCCGLAGGKKHRPTHRADASACGPV